MHFRRIIYESVKALLSGSWLDLDGDGVPEQILYTRDKQSSVDEYGGVGKAAIEIRSGKADHQLSRVEKEDCGPHPVCYTASFAGRIQLIMAWNGVSADYVVDFYEYEQEKLLSPGKIDTFVEDLKIGKDSMLARVETCHLQCQALELEYTIENGQIKWVEKDYYEYPGNSATVLLPMSLYTQKEGSDASISLEKGDEVRVLGGDLNSWVQLEKVSTGEKGWIRVTGSDCTLPDGTVEASSLLFDGLQFYG